MATLTWLRDKSGLFKRTLEQRQQQCLYKQL